MKIYKRLLILGVAASLSIAASAADISGAGATFPYPIYAKWADAYKKLTGVGLNYQSIGSGGAHVCPPGIVLILGRVHDNGGRQPLLQQGKHALPSGSCKRFDVVFVVQQGRPDAAPDAHETDSPRREVDPDLITP